MHRLAACGLALALCGCAYNASVAVTPNLNVYTSYGDRLPGSYLLHVDADAFMRTVKPSGLTCSAHNYSLDAREAFQHSVLQTVAQLVENVQMVDRPLPADEVARRGARGMILVKAEGMSARLTYIAGFWTSKPEATVDLRASLVVDRPGLGRVLGTTASGDGEGVSPYGGDCGGGSDALGVATERAMEELLGTLGERLANAPRLRRSGEAI